MASRDRWADFKQEKQDMHDTYDVEMGSVNTLTGTSLDQFLQQTEEIQRNITQISRNTADMQGLHQRVLLETNVRQQNFLTQQVDNLTDETSRLIQDTRQRIRNLSTESARSNNDAKVQSQQQKSLASRLMSVARDFQSVQQNAKQGYRSQMARQYKIARPEATSAEVEEAIDSTNGPIFQQEILSSRIGEQRSALEAVQNRHEELVKIERSITELFTLFQEMQALLDTQQEQINTIEQHVDDTDTRIADGSAQMTKAIRSAKSARKMKWIIFTIILIVLIVIALVLYFQLRPKGGNGGGDGGNQRNSTAPAR
ncbi:uncharacterized protein SPPG_00554 [Spizellomyces punctatus DAOM BR117]|uniref:t-SNARE coiled-coil homology domain-containing protein n=1 Tax=Spizellomyces punctatus (strain DAOM BR117) TaxID=645134 RepID=A0A0L0HVE4_SPIPD|nr:uncharacterized protein SPPG_00554 [Spizellomyces punctatus DAOM BR117]KND04854.1 hypothetical protein SPPG_00554 [Spizellomyces punctatus DAOM BR117]|eukprot:XP_016612893.1 hypothetical protein SPPG_00554 [Spizellomyces punctatus DAOM BR117]